MNYLSFIRGEKIERSRLKKTDYDKFIENRSVRLKVGDGEKSVNVRRVGGFDDIERLINVLKSGSGVIVDLSTAPSALVQRLLDYLSGAVFALDGSVEKLTRTMYILTPKGIDINTNA